MTTTLKERAGICDVCRRHTYRGRHVRVSIDVNDVLGWFTCPACRTDLIDQLRAKTNRAA